MLRKISFRLALTYGLIFLLAIAAVDAAIILIYRQSQYKKTEAVYQEIAGIVSEMAGRNLKVTNFLNMTGEGRSERLNGRILVMNLQGIVIADSAKQFEGRNITNRQVREALGSRKTSVGYYKYGGEEFAMLAYPMLRREVLSGVVLVSYKVEDIASMVYQFSLPVVIVSILVALTVLTVSFVIGIRMSRPIRMLTEASMEILNGNMGTTVSLKTQDEIGTLAKTFNLMSQELYRIELGRKRFVSNVSHELKTPLASIKALIDPFIGEREIDADLLNEHLKDINSEVDRLTMLVRSLLTVTRLEELKPSKEKLDVGEEVSYVFRILQPLAAERGIKLLKQCSEGIVIWGDRAMFREILVNLIDNAIKYGSENGTVKVETDLLEDNLAIVVRDNGIGIDDGDLPYIFDNFYMADEARSSGKGSGIGLYIVKRLIEINHWEISVKSTRNMGSEFKLLIKNSSTPK